MISLLLAFIFSFTCIPTVISQNIEPSYENVKSILHERVLEIFSSSDNDEIRLKAESGKFFRYTFTGDNSAGLYEAYEAGKDSLPHWLTFNSKKNKLMGIPTNRDIQNGLKIEFRRRHENGLNGYVSEATKFIFIEVVASTRQFSCGKDTTTVASIIYHSNIQYFNGHERIKILRKLSNVLDFNIHDFIVEEGNRMHTQNLITNSIQMAGPGDPVRGEQIGFTVSWKLKCASDITGDKTVGKLRGFSSNQNFQPISSVPVLGWFVFSIKGNRIRRAVKPGGTPVAGGTPSISGGTPTLSASPSVSIRSTSMIKPSPSKTSIQMTSTAVPVTPTTTDTPITTPTNTTISTKSSTAKPSTPKKNHPPEVSVDIETIRVFENQGMQVVIPSQTFFDEDGDILNIEFMQEPTTTQVAVPVKKDYWVEYSNNNLYMFPMSDSVGVHRFVLKATDPHGEYVNAMFMIQVQRDNVESYNTMFNVTLDRDFKLVNNSVQEKIKLLNTIAIAQGVSESKKLRAVEFLPGSIIVRWSVDTLKNIDCNSPEIVSLVNQLNSGTFRESFAPYQVLSYGMAEREECLGGDVLADDEEGGTWQRILIPVVVVVIVLIIILLVLCCVCRRKRKYETSSDEEIYLNQKKKPIIFEEEKHKFLSLTSASLSDDAAPMDKSYGDSDGPGSSTTVSTESEGKALIAPNSPKDTSRGYNSPPPYGS